MNIDNMLALADLLDSVPPENFDMLEWHVVRQRCGTVACIGGWATDLAGMPEGGRSDAVRFLGIDRYPADDLFEGRNWLTIPTISAAMKATPAQAAAELRARVAAYQATTHSLRSENAPTSE
jgi:hypothetical protein